MKILDNHQVRNIRGLNLELIKNIA